MITITTILTYLLVLAIFSSGTLIALCAIMLLMIFLQGIFK